ncbi:hypothetical protein [Streptomyces profundus]|uniref:hypothetical protein n=1 Tax=Streptomyces profundus TaxID=2867410 RepID=UPI001D16A68E|nr:hypothetical protein [Streptomyces sp. MA3_2.13]UED86336.1 hypothetical protein K4G22_20820 [Streptomyces sp. MA3_2.13]
MLLLLKRLPVRVRRHLRTVRRRLSTDGGYATEAVIITAVLAVLGLAAGGIIATKVIDRAKGMDLEAEVEMVGE